MSAGGPGRIGRDRDRALAWVVTGRPGRAAAFLADLIATVSRSLRDRARGQR